MGTIHLLPCFTTLSNQRAFPNWRVRKSIQVVYITLAELKRHSSTLLANSNKGMPRGLEESTRMCGFYTSSTHTRIQGVRLEEAWEALKGLEASTWAINTLTITHTRGSHCLSRVSGYDPVLDVMETLSELALPNLSNYPTNGTNPTGYRSYTTRLTLYYTNTYTLRNPQANLAWSTISALPILGRPFQNLYHIVTRFKLFQINPTQQTSRSSELLPIKLLLFPFSLEGEARTWLDKEPPRSILTWDDLVSKFINQFFPPSKTTYLRNEITTFYQKPNETFNEAWERFKGLLRQCPHHGFSELHQLDTFYNSLNTNDQDALDSAAGGNFLDKMPRDGLAIIESKSKVRYSRSRAIEPRVSTNAPLSTSTTSNSFEIQQLAASLEDKMDIRMSRLEKMISEKNVTTPATVKAVEEVCVTCGANHNFNNCPLTRSGNDFPVFHDNIHQFQQTAAVGNFVQRNPPNLATPPYQPPTNQPLVNQALPPVSQIQGVSKTDFDNYVKANDAVLKNVQNQGQNLHSASTSNSGTLPSQTVTNPREQINAITTRSGKTCEGPSTPLVPTPVVSIPSKEPEQNPETSTDKVQKPSLESTAQVPPPEEEDSIFIEIPKPKAKKTVNVEIQDLNSPRPNSYQSKLPYPERMKVRENDKPSAQHSRFLKMFKQLRLEIGLKDALVKMPKFKKWLIPEKLEDPGKFLIPCALQELDRTSALADSGASINLLPHSIYKQLGLGALKPTRMTLELANCSITHPMGIAEDVVVRVDGFTFLADFVVVNFEPNPRVPIILGRPFLRTAKALIDLYEETLTLRVGKEELVYYADKSEKNKEKKFVHAVSIIDFSKDDPFSGSTTIPSDAPFPSFSPMKTSDSTFEEFIDEFTLPNSLPPGNDDSIHKKDIHEEIFSNPLFEFDDNFKSSNVNPLFEENDKDVEIKSSSSFTLTSPEESEFEAYLERDSIPPGIDLTLPPTLEVSSSNPTSPTLTREKVCSWKTLMFFLLIRFVWRIMTRIAIRKKIICLLATFLNKKPKPLSRPQEVDDIKMKDDKVSSQIPIATIVMPIRITFDNPIDFNDHFSKPKDLKKDLLIDYLCLY
ncbi:reverse transcriptase domain-containing protein [Tanacetum coccineum]|uniref:Reverse transcriptase domain-containing protein n=1 Tax=Tanacetum coccineum TaxID=301880 RepID=A0ABQ5DDJ8_9ASTR